ncbi:MAG: hypothetical protein RLZZ419_846 [Pseudomonadota bacterium]
MPKSNFIPSPDHDFIIWFDHFITSLTPEYETAEADLKALIAASADFKAKSIHTNDAAAAAKQATAEKNDSRQLAEILIRSEVRRIKARSVYTEAQGSQLGIEGPEHDTDLSDASPNITAIDQTGGRVVINFTKYASEGINIYCQRSDDTDWLLLGRATLSPYIDNRPLLEIGKPELRRYTAIFMLKDKEIGKFSNDLVISCAP